MNDPKIIEKEEWLMKQKRERVENGYCVCGLCMAGEESRYDWLAKIAQPKLKTKKS